MIRILFISASFIFFPLVGYAESCIPTPHRTTGTHYKPVTEQRINVSQGVIVRGQILQSPDCAPVANARVAHWQAGEDGRYQDQLRAYLFTDENGRFSFETEWPNLRPPHIHFIVTADGYERLETQWVGGKRQDVIEFNMVLDPLAR